MSGEMVVAGQGAEAQEPDELKIVAGGNLSHNPLHRPSPYHLPG